jgi:diketogulonate reductase-like aldo/keto reductase
MGTTATNNYTIVNENIEKSLHRMSVNSLDLLQFHWWDYNNPYYMDALRYLSDLRDKGRIKHLGLTNFDTERTQIMVDSKLEIVPNQVQYSRAGGITISLFLHMDVFVEGLCLRDTSKQKNHLFLN